MMCQAQGLGKSGGEPVDDVDESKTESSIAKRPRWQSKENGELVAGSNAAGGEPGGESETESSIAKRPRW